VEEQLATGAMRNERHLWTSVRPNGPRRPYDLNRLELRICDLVTNPHELLAITCLLELRLLALKNNIESLDPLCSSSLSADELVQLADSNDAAVARSSLNAELQHWQDGRAISCRDWLLELIDQMAPLAESLQLSACLRPLHGLLADGNQAMRWETAHGQGQSIEDLLQKGIQRMEEEERISTGEACLG
jgi:predicted glutamate--cysteine ligase